jgi:hypothetical protein
MAYSYAPICVIKELLTHLFEMIIYKEEADSWQI